MRKIANFLYYFFYSFVGMIAIFILLFGLVHGGATILPFLLCIAVLMICLCKLLTHKNRKQLRIGSGKIPLWKPVNFLFSFTFFNVLLLAGAFCLTLTSDAITGNETNANQFSRSLAIIILSAGILYIWILHCNILFVGVKNYFLELVRFIRERVSVYLLYRLAIFAFTLVATLLMHSFSGGSSLAVQGYFLYVLESSLEDNFASGFLAGDGAIMSGLTAASSYFVLSSIALESLQESELVPFKTRLRRAFLEKDTLILMVQTIACVIVSALPDGLASQGLSKILFWGMGIIWLISFFLFLKETQLISYLLNYITLTFVETIIPIPAVSGVVGIAVISGILILRVVLFSVIAMMIAYLLHVSKMRYASQTGGNTTARIPENTTILGVGVMIANLYSNRKKIAKSALENAAAEALDKIGWKNHR